MKPVENRFIKNKECKYGDYFLFMFNISKAFDIAIIVIFFALLAAGIVLAILKGFDVGTVLLFVLLGVDLFLLSFMFFINPLLIKNKSSKNNTSVSILSDRLLISSQLGNQHAEGEIYYHSLDKLILTKSAYIFVMGKKGFILSRKNDFNEEELNILENIKISK